MPTTICKSIVTETAHRLALHQGRCFYPHGHSYKWEVMITADQLGFDGMIMDFSHLKKIMNEVIDPFDHCLVLHDEDPWSPDVLTRKDDEPRIMRVPYIPTAENMAYWVCKEIKKRLAFYDCKVTVRVWETTTSYAEYAEP